jgi:hypothetical protein
MSTTELNNRLRLINQYCQWIDQLIEHGRDDDLWDGSLVSLMFDHISGGLSRRSSIMLDEVDRIYNTLIRHCVRDTRSPTQRKRLPIALFALDNKLGAFNRNRRIRPLNSNDGLHVHGVVLVHLDCRLRVTLEMHVNQFSHYYVRDDRPLRRFHVAPIRSAPGAAVDYTLKSLKAKFEDDELLVLPKSKSEFPS